MFQNIKGIHPIIFIIPALMAAVCLYPGIFSKLGIIDDHEIVNFLHEKNSKGIIDGFISSLKSTEIFKYGEFARFRPSYYPLRIIESFIFGDNASIWYLVRILGYFFSTLVIFYITTSIFGLSWSLPFVLAACTFSYFADIFARLGPGEFYAVIGCSLTALGIFNIYRSLNKSKPSVQDLTLVVVGSIMAMGSKEYFVVMVLPVVLVLLTSCKRVGFTLGNLSSIFLILFYAAFVFSAMAIYFSSNSVDVYHQSVSLHERGRVFGAFLQKSSGIFFLLEVLIMFVISYRQYRQNKLSKFCLVLTLNVALIVFLVASQLFFNGDINNRIRYAYPWALLLMINHLIFFYRIHLHCSGNKIKYVFIALCLVTSVENRFGLKILDKSLANMHSSRTFDKKMAHIKAVLVKESSVPLLLSVNDPFKGYEPITSFLRYAKYYGISNPIYLCANYRANAVNTPTKKRLHKRIINWQGGGKEHLQPIENLNKDKRYFIVNLGTLKHDVCNLKRGEQVANLGS